MVRNLSRSKCFIFQGRLLGWEITSPANDKLARRSTAHPLHHLPYLSLLHSYPLDPSALRQAQAGTVNLTHSALAFCQLRGKAPGHRGLLDLDL